MIKIQVPAGEQENAAAQQLGKIFNEDLTDAKTTLSKIQSDYNDSILSAKMNLSSQLGAIVKDSLKLNKMQKDYQSASYEGDENVNSNFKVVALMQRVKMAIDNFFHQSNEQHQIHVATNFAIRKIFCMIESKSNLWSTLFRQYESEFQDLAEQAKEARRERDAALTLVRDTKEALTQTTLDLKKAQRTLAERDESCDSLRSELHAKNSFLKELTVGRSDLTKLSDTICPSTLDEESDDEDSLVERLMFVGECEILD